MTAYLARYLIVDDYGDPIYTGTATVTSTPVPLGQDPIADGAIHANFAETIRASCDQQPAVPAGRVVVTLLKEAS